MSTPMVCPACGSVMNHHADKIIYSDRGEQVEQFYQCPNCGAIATRPAKQQLITATAL